MSFSTLVDISIIIHHGIVVSIDICTTGPIANHILQGTLHTNITKIGTAAIDDIICVVHRPLPLPLSPWSSNDQ